jgi:hypothetical protein
VWTVAFEPEPWKARRVGFLGVDIMRCVSEDLVARVGGEEGGWMRVISELF